MYYLQYEWPCCCQTLDSICSFTTFFFIYIQCVMLLKTHINYQYAIIQPFYMTMMIMGNKLWHGWVISFNGVFVIELLCMDGVHRTFTQCVTIRDQQWLLWKLGNVSLVDTQIKTGKVINTLFYVCWAFYHYFENLILNTLKHKQLY